MTGNAEVAFQLTKSLTAPVLLLDPYWSSRNSGERVNHRKYTRCREDQSDGRFPVISATSRNSLKVHDINRTVTLPNAQNFPVIGPSDCTLDSGVGSRLYAGLQGR
jgi:hypothetical protein